MKNRSIIILLVLLLSAGISQAQEELPEFSADRPGYTTGTGIVPRHKVACENGFGYESLPDGAHCLTLNNTMVRYGDGETAAPQTDLALATGFNITDDIGAFVETYNYLHPEGEHQFMTEFGLTWMPIHRLQFDLGDLDFEHFGKYYAIGGGVAWMIN